MMRKSSCLLLAFSASCLTVQIEPPIQPQSMAVERAWEEWQYAGLPDVSGCVASFFVVPAVGPQFIERTCLWFNEAEGCVSPFSGLTLIVVAPGIPAKDHFDPISHEAMHAMTACVRGGQHPDPFDKDHKDQRVWSIRVEPEP